MSDDNTKTQTIATFYPGPSMISLQAREASLGSSPSLRVRKGDVTNYTPTSVGDTFKCEPIGYDLIDYQTNVTAKLPLGAFLYLSDADTEVKDATVVRVPHTPDLTDIKCCTQLTICQASNGEPQALVSASPGDRFRVKATAWHLVHVPNGSNTGETIDLLGPDDEVTVGEVSNSANSLIAPARSLGDDGRAPHTVDGSGYSVEC
jgi:hypothetical protein